jgi:hypothetical protein
VKLMLAVIVMAGAALAGEPAPPEWLRTKPNPEVLKWQFEAQERERADARRMDWQIERGKAKTAAEKDKKKAVAR